MLHSPPYPQIAHEVVAMCLVYPGCRMHVTLEALLFIKKSMPGRAKHLGETA